MLYLASYSQPLESDREAIYGLSGIGSKQSDRRDRVLEKEIGVEIGIEWSTRL